RVSPAERQQVDRQLSAGLIDRYCSGCLRRRSRILRGGSSRCDGQYEGEANRGETSAHTRKMQKGSPSGEPLSKPEQTLPEGCRHFLAVAFTLRRRRRILAGVLFGRLLVRDVAAANGRLLFVRRPADLDALRLR